MYEKIDNILASPFVISFELRGDCSSSAKRNGGQTILAQVASTNITNQVTNHLPESYGTGVIFR